MSVYCLALITIHDRERYGQYEAGFMEIFNRHAGRLLAVEEEPVAIEGDWPHTRTVLLEFPDAEALAAWAGSTEYRTLAEHRHAASTGTVVMIRALAQPAA